MNPLDFSGKRTVVTGAAGGIGGAVTALLLERGSEVIACDLRAPTMPGLSESVGADIATPTGRELLAATAGSCDYLVLAHGIIRPKPISETDEDDWDTILSVNAKAVYFLCKSFGSSLREGGAIVTLSSVSARLAASLEQSVYCASKAAVSSITRTFAYALAPRRIRVNAVLPGIIDTPMQEGFLARAAAVRGTTPHELHEARLSSIPLRRTSSAEECAETVLWLLSPAASYLTGQQIAADGGLTMF